MNKLFLGALTVVLFFGCSDNSEAGEGGDETVDVASGDATTTPPDVPTVADTGPGDTSLPDTFNPDEPIPFVPCDDNSDCDSDWCVETADGKTCTRTCIDSCPNGWLCGSVSNTGQDVTYICLPQFTTLCMPCHSDSDCSVAGSSSAGSCLSYGEAGSYCGTACEEADDCPGGYACDLGQCRIESGECGCSWKAIKEAASTSCTLSNEFGTCTGQRGCLSKTLSACSAAAPGAEICDSQDNDCDGLIDEEIPLDPCSETTAAGTCTGVVECAAGTPQCTAAVPTAESCDGIDNDCDGLADEEFTNTDNDGEADCIDEDDDDDGLVDPDDNCPVNVNPDQEDQDQNNIGDACDGDLDGDGDPNATDCAPSDPTIGKTATEVCNGIDDDCDAALDEGFSDLDANGVADCVDEDDDGDGVLDAEDNCPVSPNPAQTDSDGDGKGDVCEEDDDEDGDPDVSDCAPLDPGVHHGANELCNGADENCNGIVDEGFPETNGDGVADCIDTDDDGDGVADEEDLCPLVFDPDQLDSDDDGKGDACDTDDDDDGSPDIIDCAPLDPAANPKATEVCNQKDDDCDGITDEEGAVDCNPYFYDGDNDGFGAGTITQCLCQPKVPFTAVVSGDCDDQNGQVFPGATEICNLKDDDCDGPVDEGAAVGCLDGYVDGDKDGFGTGDSACVCPGSGYASQSGDCDDTNSAIKPGVLEQCNGYDDNCNELDDEPGASGCQSYYLDIDDDGYGVSGELRCLCAADVEQDYTAPVGGDCDDGDEDRFPSNPEVCDTKDNNCNGQVDEGVKTTFFLDEDEDNFGASYSPQDACEQPDNHVAKAGDCNDFNGAIYPGADEACNEIDDDCNGQTDDGLPTQSIYKDNDSDGFAPINAASKPKCDVPIGWALPKDADGDLANDWDCDDSDVTVYPLAPTVCGDGKDNNCDAVVDRLCFVECSGDWPYQPTFSSNRPTARPIDMNGDGNYEIYVGHSFGTAILRSSGVPLYDYSAAVHNFARGIPTAADIDGYDQHGPGVQSIEILGGNGSHPTFYRMNTDQTVSVITSPEGVYDASDFMAWDIDHDGAVEFVTSTWCEEDGAEIYRFDRDNDEIVRVAGVADPDDVCQYTDGRMLTDMNGDGVVELLYGNGYAQPTAPQYWAGNIYAEMFTDLATFATEPFCTDCFPTAIDGLFGGGVAAINQIGGTIRAQVTYFETNAPQQNNPGVSRFWTYDLAGALLEGPSEATTLWPGATDIDDDGDPESYAQSAWLGFFDMNGDGYPDRVQTAGDSLQIALWNPQSKSFVLNAGSSLPVSSATLSVQSAWDLDGNGRLNVLSSDESGKLYCHELGKGTWNKHESLPPHQAMPYRTYQWDNYEPNEGEDDDGDGIPDRIARIPSALTAGGDFYSYLSHPNDEDYFLLDTSWAGNLCVRAPPGRNYSLHIWSMLDRWDNSTEEPGADGMLDGLVWEDTGSAQTKCWSGNKVAPNRYGEYRFVVAVRSVDGSHSEHWPYWISAPK